eukprot:gene22541-32647_t
MKAWIGVLTVGVLCRVAPLAFGWGGYFSKRPEFATAISSSHGANECVALLQQGVSPYSGAICKETPLVVHSLAALDDVAGGASSSSALSPLAVVLMICDLLTAVFLGKLAAGEQIWQLAREETALKELKKSATPEVHAAVEAAPTLIRYIDQNRAVAVAAVWLLNPLAVMTYAAQTLTVVHNTATAAALYFAFVGAVPAACFWLALASYQSLYPVVLLTPVVLAARAKGWSPLTTVSIYAVYCTGFVIASVQLEGGSWQWAKSVYGTIIFVDDLQPNIGLW